MRARSIVFAIFVLIVIGVVIGVGLSLLSPQKPPSPAPVNPAVVRAAVQRLESPSIEPAAGQNPNPAAPSPAAPASVRYSAGDVNTAIASDPQIHNALQGQGVTDLTVTFQAPNIVVFTAWIHNREVTDEGTVTPTPDGTLQFHQTSMQVGLLPLPAGTGASQIEPRANSALAQYSRQLPIRVTGIDVDQGAMVLTGPRK
jgi:hypothetical protein